MSFIKLLISDRAGQSAWNFIFNKLNLQNVATQGLKNDIHKNIQQQTQVPLTLRNIYRILGIVRGTTTQRMDKALLEVLDKITSITLKIAFPSNPGRPIAITWLTVVLSFLDFANLIRDTIQTIEPLKPVIVVIVSWWKTWSKPFVMSAGMSMTPSAAYVTEFRILIN